MPVRRDNDDRKDWPGNRTERRVGARLFGALQAGHGPMALDFAPRPPWRVVMRALLDGQTRVADDRALSQCMPMHGQHDHSLKKPGPGDAAERSPGLVTRRRGVALRRPAYLLWLVQPCPCRAAGVSTVQVAPAMPRERRSSRAF